MPVSQPCTRENHGLVADEFRIENVPCSSEEQRTGRVSMVQDGMWTPQPLPLYDTTGKIVIPGHYESALRGSLTNIKFSLTRHREAHSETYRYRANVEEIHVLERTQVSIASRSHARLVESICKSAPPH